MTGDWIHLFIFDLNKQWCFEPLFINYKLFISSSSILNFARLNFEFSPGASDKRDIEHKRAWDAMLHAGKVFAIQMKVQSIASKYGFTYQHGCGCDSHLSSIDVSSGTFEYDLSSQKRHRWIRSFIWTSKG